MIFMSLRCHPCDHVTGFDVFRKILIVLVFPVDFSQKYWLLEMSAFFHFSYVFFYFVGIMSVCLNKKLK